MSNYLRACNKCGSMFTARDESTTTCYRCDSAAADATGKFAIIALPILIGFIFMLSPGILLSVVWAKIFTVDYHRFTVGTLFLKGLWSLPIFIIFYFACGKNIKIASIRYLLSCFVCSVILYIVW